MSTPSQRRAVIDEAKKISAEIARIYPGAKSLGAGEIAALIARMTSRRRASAASVANALRDGKLHDGRNPRGMIDHPVRKIWNVPVEAAALNIAEIIQGVARGVSIDDIRAGWYVVRIEPMEPIGAIAQERVVLDYRPDAPSDPERSDAADVAAFLDAIGAEIQRLESVARAEKDRRILRRVARRDP
ncbi:MAG TPA: hypothetical protein VIO59_03485 [Rhodanobacter sp.]